MAKTKESAHGRLMALRAEKWEQELALDDLPDEEADQCRLGLRMLLEIKHSKLKEMVLAEQDDEVAQGQRPVHDDSPPIANTQTSPPTPVSAGGPTKSPK